MARGTVYKRCQCRDRNGQRLKACRKDHGAWWFKFEAAPDSVSGRRRQVAKGGFRTRVDAEMAMTQVQHELDHGLWVDDKSMTLGDWLTIWLDENRITTDIFAGYEQARNTNCS